MLEWNVVRWLRRPSIVVVCHAGNLPWTFFILSLSGIMTSQVTLVPPILFQIDAEHRRLKVWLPLLLVVLCCVRTLPDRSVLLCKVIWKRILILLLLLLLLLYNTHLLLLNKLFMLLGQRLPSRSVFGRSTWILFGIWNRLFLRSWFDIVLIFQLVYFPIRHSTRLRPSFRSFVNKLRLNVDWNVLRRIMVVFLIECPDWILLVLVLMLLYRNLRVGLRSLLERSCARHLFSSQVLVVLLKCILEILRIVAKLYHLIFVITKVLALDQCIVL